MRKKHAKGTYNYLKKIYTEQNLQLYNQNNYNMNPKVMLNNYEGIYRRLLKFILQNLSNIF